MNTDQQLRQPPPIKYPGFRLSDVSGFTLFQREGQLRLTGPYLVGSGDLGTYNVVAAQVQRTDQEFMQEEAQYTRVSDFVPSQQWMTELIRPSFASTSVNDRLIIDVQSRLVEIMEEFDSASQGSVDRFREELEAILDETDYVGLNEVKELIATREEDARISWESLEIIGRSRNEQTRRARRIFLLDALQANNPRYRYSAAIGLTYLKGETTTAALQLHKGRERSAMVRGAIEAALR